DVSAPMDFAFRSRATSCARRVSQDFGWNDGGLRGVLIGCGSASDFFSSTAPSSFLSVSVQVSAGRRRTPRTAGVGGSLFSFRPWVRLWSAAFEQLPVPRGHWPRGRCRRVFTALNFGFADGHRLCVAGLVDHVGCFHGVITSLSVF